MELQGDVSINTEGEVVVDHAERECVSAFLRGFKVFILCHINAPSIQVHNLPISYVAQDLADWFICVAGIQGLKDKHMKKKYLEGGSYAMTYSLVLLSIYFYS